MELSPEDGLRLQVLLQNELKAVRLDEHAMILYALTAAGEANIPLSPNRANDEYLKVLRSTLSEHILGSAGGYPVYLKRWTRMQQTSHSSLKDLLKLGENEAVMAVTNAEQLDLDVAKLSWWCTQNLDIQPEAAYHLLQHKIILQDDLGKEIASYLYEYLPFMQDTEKTLNTLVSILQPGLLDHEQIAALANRAKNKSVYQVGFLVARMESFLAEHAENPVRKKVKFIDGSPISNVLKKSLSTKGQTFINSAKTALNKISSEEVTYPLINTIGEWFAEALFVKRQRVYEQYTKQVELMMAEPERCHVLYVFLEKNPDSENLVRAVLLLAGVYEAIVFKDILHTGAVGSQLRRKIKDTLKPMLQALNVLSDL